METIQEELESRALTIPNKAQSIVVASKADMEQADVFNRNIKAMVKEVDETFKPLADKAFQAHRAITGKWAEIKKPLTEATEIITKKVREYIQEEKRKAEAEEARLREEARKLEEERRMQEALELEREGRKEEAQAIIDEPITFVAPTVKADILDYDKRTYRAPTPKAKVTDKKKFVQWCSLSPDRLGYLLIDDKALNQQAKRLGKEIEGMIPGTEYFEE